jgi:hypothetical protein
MTNSTHARHCSPFSLFDLQLRVVTRWEQWKNWKLFSHKCLLIKYVAIILCDHLRPSYLPSWTFDTPPARAINRKLETDRNVLIATSLVYRSFWQSCNSGLAAPQPPGLSPSTLSYENSDRPRSQMERCRVSLRCLPNSQARPFRRLILALVLETGADLPFGIDGTFKSLIGTLSLPATGAEVVMTARPAAVGWELNTAGRTGPRLADLAPMMDPVRYA